MAKKTFCPFINGECVSECMFHTISSVCYDDNVLRNCLIATASNSAQSLDRIETFLEDDINPLKHH